MALACVAFLGLGSAYVLAGPKGNGTPATGGIEICHATASEKNPFVDESPDASSIVGNNGHGGHPDDIIPPFYYIENGTQYFYPGMNMTTLYGAGYTGAEVLANGCDIPTGRGITTTSTETTTVVTTTTQTVSVPGTTVTLPGTTTIKEITVTVSVPGTTVTTPGATTVVTVPAGQTTTVAIQGTTVTVPAATQTLPGETVQRPDVTVTQPGTTQTITAGPSTTVVTVTAPKKSVEGGVLAAKEVIVTVTTPSHTVYLKPHLVHAITKAVAGAKVVMIKVIRASCLAGVNGKG